MQSITPNDSYHYFFGYYDLQPYDKACKRHLAHRVSFADRLPTKEDSVDVGYITLDDKIFHKVGESRAWNFQQGALLQWFDEDNIIFNDFREEHYVCVIKNVNSGDERIIDSPLACVSQDRKFGLSVNFSRIYDFRPGYGYCNLQDKFKDVNAPDTDGIFLVDIKSGTKKLIIDYKRLKEEFPSLPFSDMKLVVNHITFNPSAGRFLFLLRNFPEEGKKWGTALVTADRDGNELRFLTGYEVNSHYHWKNDDEIMIYAGLPKWGVYFINDKTGSRTMLDDDTVNEDDVHCLYSPDRSLFIADGYPDKENFRHMFCYDFNAGKSAEILRIYSKPVDIIDIRCDLHNRFSPDGQLISFDSTHSGRREICQIDF